MLVLMRMGLVVIALLAACGGQGVDLEVTSDVPFDRVELFLGNDICYDARDRKCDQGVAWESGMARPPGDVFVMKGDENVVVAEMRGDTAVLHLEATDMFREPKLLAIVGFHGGTAVAYATLSGERIPSNSGQRWQVKLEAADVATEDIMTGPTGEELDRRVYAWQRAHVADPSALSRCLAMQKWDAGEGLWKSLFVVPDSDPDCDGQDIECDPLYANFNEGAPPALCVTPMTSITSMPCAIGTSLCADGKSTDDTCTLDMDKRICVPQFACDECVGQPALASCLSNAIRTNTTPTHFECAFIPGDNGGSCGTSKTGAINHLILPMACDQVEVRPATMPLSSSGTPGTAFVDTAEIRVTVVPGTTTSCTIALQWTAGLAQPGEIGYFVFMVRSAITGNVAAIPVALKFGQGPAACDTPVEDPPTCEDRSSLLQDSLYECL